jgi:hypothetical protein
MQAQGLVSIDSNCAHVRWSVYTETMHWNHLDVNKTRKNKSAEYVLSLGKAESRERKTIERACEYFKSAFYIHVHPSRACKWLPSCLFSVKSRNDNTPAY